jgi:uncharacterized membrane protein (GlpM family)
MKSCPKRISEGKAPVKTLLKQAFNALTAPIAGFCIGLFACRLLFPEVSIDISLASAVICFFVGAAIRLLAMQIPRRTP